MQHDHLPSSPDDDQIDSVTLTCPEKCSYYKTFDGVKPFIFKVESGFGAVEVSAEPYHRFQKTGDSKIWLVFNTPNGQTLTKSIKATPDKKVLPRLAKECGVVQQWEEKVRKSFSSKVENPRCKFKVQIVGEDEYEWIEGCILKSIPNPPIATNFIFTTPENTILASHFGEFEEM